MFSSNVTFDGVHQILSNSDKIVCIFRGADCIKVLVFIVNSIPVVFRGGGGDFAPRRHLEDIFSCHTGGASGQWWVEVRDDPNYPTLHRKTPTAKNFLASNVNSAEAEAL